MEEKQEAKYSSKDLLEIINLIDNANKRKDNIWVALIAFFIVALIVFVPQRKNYCCHCDNVLPPQQLQQESE